MFGIQFLDRFVVAAVVHGSGRQWSGQTKVILVFDCASDGESKGVRGALRDGDARMVIFVLPVLPDKHAVLLQHGPVKFPSY